MAEVRESTRAENSGVEWFRGWKEDQGRERLKRISICRLLLLHSSCVSKIATGDTDFIFFFFTTSLNRIFYSSFSNNRSLSEWWIKCLLSNPIIVKFEIINALKQVYNNRANLVSRITIDFMENQRICQFADRIWMIRNLTRMKYSQWVSRLLISRSKSNVAWAPL